MVIELTLTTVLIFVGFIVTVFVLYKLIKFFFRASLIVAASFTFPWIAKYFGLAITANLETGILFALSGFIVFCIYEFFHFVVQFFKMVTWPFRRKGGK
jgi:lipoprotein signal peptidase